VGLSHERSDIAGAESFYSLEGNMCGTAMRGADALPGSKAVNRQLIGARGVTIDCLFLLHWNSIQREKCGSHWLVTEFHCAEVRSRRCRASIVVLTASCRCSIRARRMDSD